MSVGLRPGRLAHHTTHEPGGSDYTVDPDVLTTGEATMPRRFVSTAAATTGNQIMRLTYFTARKSETITQVRLISGTTAAGTPTLIRIGLYTAAGNGDITLVASTANDTALLAATLTAYTKALSASYAKVAGQRYAWGLLVLASVLPTVYGSASLTTPEAGMSPRLGGFASGLSDLPSSVVAASIGDSAQLHYGVLLP